MKTRYIKKTNMRLMKVLTEPMTERGTILSQDEMDSHGAILSIPEVMKKFPKLLQKYKDVYDWYVVEERLDADLL